MDVSIISSVKFTPCIRKWLAMFQSNGKELDPRTSICMQGSYYWVMSAKCHTTGIQISSRNKPLYVLYHLGWLRFHSKSTEWQSLLTF